MSQPNAADELRSYREAQAYEYGVFVAKRAIDVNGVRAFNPGDPVPVSTVEREGWHEGDDAAVETSGPYAGNWRRPSGARTTKGGGPSPGAQASDDKG